jgi:ubiquinone/menaquinone biosynthesis C-methylase UbiE
MTSLGIISGRSCKNSPYLRYRKTITRFIRQKIIPRLVMRKITATISLLFIFLQMNAQKMQIMKGYCGYYYRSMKDLRRQRQAELDFYRFKPGQAVASIGAQCGHWEAAYASTTDSLQFYLEDIDTTYFNQRQVSFAWHYYDSLRGRPMTSTFTLITGTEESTLLPENNFDKIIIINSFHEFTRVDEMLADIKTKLKVDGILYIDETVPKRPGQLHGVCKKPMLTPEQMISILSKNGYEYVDALEIIFRKGKPFRKIYAFRNLASS